MDDIILKCIDDLESKKTLKDMHEGVCGGHYMDKTTAHKVLRFGFGCQHFSEMLKNLSRYVIFVKDLVES